MPGCAEGGRWRAGAEVALWGAAAVGVVGAAGLVTLAVLAVVRWRRRRARRKGVVLSGVECGVGPGVAGAAGAGWLSAAGAAAVPCALPHATMQYKGESVYVRYVPSVAGELKLRSRAVDLLLLMQGLTHDNVNPFLGVVRGPRCGLAWRWGSRGSLWRVLRADGAFLQWAVRASLLRDLVRGLGALHAAVGPHARLTSRNCVVDARWTLRLTDYCLPSLYRAQGIPLPERPPEDLLWTAPELLRELTVSGSDGTGGRVAGTGGCIAGAGGSVAGDVYAVGIILQEVVLLDRPYCMLALSPQEIIEKIRHPPPLVRPWLPLSAGPPSVVRAARACWAEAPDLRPTLSDLVQALDSLQLTRKSNTVDGMFEMLEKYSYNLEEVVKQRTELLELEKKKTENLLNRMLPRSVAARLVRGEGVPAEEFAAVTVCFADIVGFTAWAARCRPVQVVARLNDLYSRFDSALDALEGVYKGETIGDAYMVVGGGFDSALDALEGVYKVETIGDAYMVVGGAPCRSRSHAEDAARAALVLLREARGVSVRAGLASGPAAAGVVGRTMPRYCLFGDTVNTASRMESTGLPGCAQLSASTAALLRAAGGWRLEARGVLWVKGKGHMTTYWLLGTDKPLPPTASDDDGEPPSTPGHVTSSTSSAGTISASTSSTATLRRIHFERQQSYPSHLIEGSSRAEWLSSTEPPPSAHPPHSAHGPRECLQRQWSLERDVGLAVAAALRPVASRPASPSSRY